MPDTISLKGLKTDNKFARTNYKRGMASCAQEDSKHSPSHVEVNKTIQKQRRESERLWSVEFGATYRDYPHMSSAFVKLKQLARQ